MAKNKDTVTFADIRDTMTPAVRAQIEKQLGAQSRDLPNPQPKKREAREAVKTLKKSSKRSTSFEQIANMPESTREAIAKQLKEQGVEGLSPSLKKILNLVKSNEDDKKQIIKENADTAKKNTEQISELNDSLGKILTSQIKTTGLLRELLQTIKDNKDNKEEEPKQKKSWFRRLVDAAVGVITLGAGAAGLAVLGNAAATRAGEIATNGENGIIQSPENGAHQPTPLPEQEHRDLPRQTSEQLQRQSNIREESQVQPRATIAIPEPSRPLSMPASYRESSEEDIEKSNITSIISNQKSTRDSLPSNKSSIFVAATNQAHILANDNVDATPIYDENDIVKTSQTANISKQDAEPVLQDLPSMTRDYTFKADEIRFKADEFKFEQQATPIMGADAVAGSSVISASMPVSIQPQTAQVQDGGMSGRNGSGTTPNLATIRTRSGRTAQVAADRQAQFQGFIDELESTGYVIRDLGGYANRNIRGGNTRSAHADGMAIDINPSQNPFRTTTTDMPPNVRDIARRWGLGWGMDFRSTDAQGPRTDPMHFSAAPNEGGGQPSVTQNSPTAQQSAPTPVATVQPATHIPSPQSQVGPALAAASAQRSMAVDLPSAPAPTIIQTSAPDDNSPAPAGFGGQQYPLDPNDPGPVEPANAIERYNRLFDMATIAA